MTVDSSRLVSRRVLVRMLIAGFLLLFLAGCTGMADAASGYDVAYGETVKIAVNNPFGGVGYLYIQGPNFPFTPLLDASGNQMTVAGRGVRAVEIDTSAIRGKNGKSPDIGTYTIYVSNKEGATGPNNLDSGNGFWDAYSLTLRPIGITLDTVSTVQPTPVPTTTPVSTFVPVTPVKPVATPASPAPGIVIIAGLGAAIFALRR